MAASDDVIRAWIEAGLYDPAADDADGRRELLEWMHERGLTVASMVAANRKGQLGSLAADTLLRADPHWTLREIAEQLDTTIDSLNELRRAAGFPPTDPDTPSFTDSDVVMFRSFHEAATVFSDEELLHFSRVVGTSLRRIADAASEMFLLDVEMPLRDAGGGGELALAKTSVEAIEMTQSAIAVFEPLFRASLEQATQASRAARRNTVDKGTLPLAVGFVDLSGFTSMVEQVGPRELLKAVLDFEAAAYDLVAECGGRVVKMIGDEVMFTTIDAESACNIAIGLLRTVGTGESVRPRGAVAFGDVIAHGGDIYGVPVNRASRMADLAVPDEVLVDGNVVAHAASHRFEPAGRRHLKGFRDPVPLWSIAANAG